MIRDVTIDVSPRFSYDRCIDDDPLSVAWPPIPPGYRLMLMQRLFMRADRPLPCAVAVNVSAGSKTVLRADCGRWLMPDECELLAEGALARMVWRLDEVSDHIDLAMASGSLINGAIYDAFGVTSFGGGY
jgi:hypothetical protein